jgi:hypothetical protein
MSPPWLDSLRKTLQTLRRITQMTLAADERIWHTSNSRGQILTLSVRLKILNPSGWSLFARKRFSDFVKLPVFLKLTNKDPFAAWFVVTGDATPDARVVARRGCCQCPHL